jgi:hypothetical protein
VCASQINTLRPGDTTKPDPFTVVILSNPALEAPWNSGTFVVDPITSMQAAFNTAASRIVSALFALAPGQRERFIADPSIGPRIRVISAFVSGVPAQHSNSLVGQDPVSTLLVARRAVFMPFLAGIGINVADVVYAVSLSETHRRASAWFTSDDDAKGGIGFTLDSGMFSHRFFNLVPGTVAIHASTDSLTPLHEFGHALSSYTNGKVVDLYTDSGPGINNKSGRPIPPHFDSYDGSASASDLTRDGLGYPAGWSSYHGELIDPALPAVMDNYFAAGTPETCQHDTITRQFLIDRLRAKISR